MFMRTAEGPPGTFIDIKPEIWSRNVPRELKKDTTSLGRKRSSPSALLEDEAEIGTVVAGAADDIGFETPPRCVPQVEDGTVRMRDRIVPSRAPRYGAVANNKKKRTRRLLSACPSRN